MIIKVRVNKNDSRVYKLCSWDSSIFEATQTLNIQSDSFADVRDAFSEIESIEVFVANNLVAEYTCFDSFEAITYSGKTYVEHENVFAEKMQVRLTKASIVEQVNRLDSQVNKVYDIDAMTTEEYRDYLLKQIGSQCRSQIHDGLYIEISTGVKKFTYNEEDQQNILTAFSLLVLAQDAEYIPYHSSHEGCYLMKASDMVTIFATLQLNLTYLTTRGNAFNMWIASVNNKEDLMKITWESELPQEYQENITNIMTYSEQMIQALIGRFAAQQNQSQEDETDEGDSE